MSLPRIRMASGSKEFQPRIPITVTADAGADVDETDLPAELAFLAPGSTPSEDDWIDAEWDTVGDSNIVRALIGEGTDTELEPGPYIVWLRLTANPEIPVMHIAHLTVY